MKAAFLAALLASVLGTPASGESLPPSEPEDVVELLVVGSRLPTEEHKVGRALTVMDQEQIRNLGHKYVADLFRFIPGVAVNRVGGYSGVTQLRLRGAEGNHVLVLIDGVDATAAGTGEFDFSALLAADIERIEVLRGPQSGLYGSNAMAGVISIHTRRADSAIALDVDLETGGDSTRHGAVSMAGGNDYFQGRLTWSQRHSDFDLSSNDALIGSEADQDDNQTLSGQLRARFSDTLTIDVFGRHNTKDTETDGFDFSGGPLQGLAIDDSSFTDTEDTTLAVVGTLSLAEDRSITRLAIETTDSEIDGGVFGSESNRDNVRFDTTWHWPHTDRTQHRTTVFAQAEDESFRNRYPLDPSQRPTQDRQILGYGIEHRIAVDETLFVNGAVRHDDNDGFDDATTFSVDLAYLINGGNTRLHASYGSGIVNPTFFEQFGFVPGIFTGNPDLKPERSTGWDVGIEQAFGDGRTVVDLTYFDADLQDEIQSVFPSVLNLAGDSERKGVELGLSYRAAPATLLTAHYAYTDASEPGGEEIRRPEHTASLTASHRLLNARLTLSGSVVYNGEQLDSDFRNFFTNGFMTERTELDAYTLVHLSAAYRIRENLEVYFRLENVFDEDYEEVLSYATPGRSVFAGIRFSLGN